MRRNVAESPRPLVDVSGGNSLDPLNIFRQTQELVKKETQHPRTLKVLANLEKTIPNSQPNQQWHQLKAAFMGFYQEGLPIDPEIVCRLADLCSQKQLVTSQVIEKARSYTLEGVTSFDQYSSAYTCVTVAFDHLANSSKK
jgi:hypothetical protein